MSGSKSERDVTHSPAVSPGKSSAFKCHMGTNAGEVGCVCQLSFTDRRPPFGKSHDLSEIQANKW